MKHISNVVKALVVLCLTVGSADAQWLIANGPTGTGYLRVDCFVTNGSKLFAGCTGGGVFVTTNSGATWTTANDGLKSLNVGSLIFRGTTLYAGTSAGLYASTNEGTTWDSIHVSVQGPFAAIGEQLFGAGFSGVFASTNIGAPWLPANSGLSSGGIGIVALDSTLFLGAYPWSVYRSTNYGGSWETSSAGLPANPLIIAIFSSGKHLFAAVQNSSVYRSTDHGNSWSLSNSGLPTSLEWHFVASGSTLFVGTYGNGVYVSSNDGANWTEVNLGLPNKVVRSIAVVGSELIIGLYEGTVYKRPLSQMVTSVNPGGEQNPGTFDLAQNYPNPFNPSTIVQYAIPTQAYVTLSVYNALGQLVKELVRGEVEAGVHQVSFDASAFPSGIYYYRLQTGEYVSTKTMAFLK